MIIFLLYLGRSLKMVIVFKNLKILKPHLAIVLAMHVTTCSTLRVDGFLWLLLLH